MIMVSCQAAMFRPSFLQLFHYLEGVKHTESPTSGTHVGTLPFPFQKWFAEKGWSPRAHQLELMARARGGENMLLIAPTGAGKTLGGFMASLTDLAERGKVPAGSGFVGVHTLYISPLKALAVDIERNLTKPVFEMGLPISIETRTGDTPQAKRQRQKVKPPDILLTTPSRCRCCLPTKRLNGFSAT